MIQPFSSNAHTQFFVHRITFLSYPFNRLAGMSDNKIADTDRIGAVQLHDERKQRKKSDKQKTKRQTD